MAQTGFTPIQLYFSSTTTNVPLAANLANGELAINITDGKLFYKDNASAVQVIGWKVVPTTAGGTGLTSYTAGDLPYYTSGTALSKLGIGASTTVVTSTGSAPQWTAQSALSVGEASNLKSNATTGVMQITGPTAASTRVMTIPDANFTVARTDAAQSFSGLQTFGSGVSVTSGKVTSVYGAGGDFVALFQNTTSATPYGVWIKDASGPAAGYPLLNISDSAGTTTYFRVDSSNGDARVGIGNLVIGTSGKGIDFSATPGTGTSELLADYEEGTWTPVVTAGVGSITAYTASGKYTKIGRQVTVTCDITVSNNGTGALYLLISGLPFSSGSASYPIYGCNNTSGGAMTGTLVGTDIYAQKYNATYPLISGENVLYTSTYFV